MCGAAREPFIVSYNVCIRAYYKRTLPTMHIYAYICILLASSIWYQYVLYDSYTQ